MAWAFALSACTGDIDIHPLPWPALPPSTRAVLVVIEAYPPARGSNDPFLVEARSVDGLGQAPVRADFDVDPNAEIWVFAYERSLVELGIASGTVPRPLADAMIRPIPSPDVVFVREEPSGGQWRSVAPGAELPEVQIPAFDVVSCLDNGRCPTFAGISTCELCQEVSPPESPAPPEPPQLPTPLRLDAVAGTSTTHLGAHPLLVPEPPLPRITCTRGEAQPPDLDTCLRVGRPCAGRWPTDLPAGPVRYVDASAQAGGDGTVASPFASIVDAIGDAPPGSVVAIAAGTYTEWLDLRAPISLIGACAAETILVVPAFNGAHIAADVTIRNLSIRGGDKGLWVDVGGSATVESVSIEGGLQGIAINGGSGRFKDILVRGIDGIGVEVTDGGHATLERVYVEDTKVVGVHALGQGVTIDAKEIVIRGPADQDVIPLRAGDGGVIRLDKGLLESGGLGGAVLDGNCVLEANDLIIRDVEDTVSKLGGAGIFALSSSRLEVQRLWITRVRFAGIELGTHSTATLSDVTVVDVRARVDEDNLSAAIHVLESEVAVDRANIADVQASAVMILSHSIANLRDVDIARTGRGAIGTQAQGFSVSESTVHIDRARVVESKGFALRTATGLSVVTLNDFEVARSTSSGIYGVSRDDRIIGARVRMKDSIGAGLVTNSYANVELTDVYVSGMSQGFARNFGALAVERDGGMQIDRFLIEDNDLAGLDIEGFDEATLEKRFSNGLVRMNTFGVISRVPYETLPAYLSNVRFEANGAILGNAL